MRGATLPYMLFRILLVSSDEMPLKAIKEIMGLVIIDHWAQKSVSDRFVFFLGIILLLAVGNTPFAFILGTSALPCHDGMKIHRRHRQRKNEFLPLGRQSH